MKPPTRPRSKPNRFSRAAKAGIEAPLRQQDLRHKRKLVCGWKVGHRQSLLKGLKAQGSTITEGAAALDYTALQTHLPSKPVTEIHSMVEALQTRLLSHTHHSLRSQSREQQRMSRPIELWLEQASRVSGTLEEPILTAFSQMFTISSMEPVSQRNPHSLAGGGTGNLLTTPPHRAGSPVRTPTPHSSAPRTPTPHSSTVRTPGPHSSTVRTPTPHSSAPRTPTPHSSAPRTPTPHSSAPRTPTPHSSTVRTPGPHSSTVRTPTPHSSAPRTPGPHSSAPRTPGSDTSQSPTPSATISETPMACPQSQTPPMGGLQSQTPPMGGPQSQTPMGGLQSQTPMGSLQSQPPPMGGLQSQTPMGGLQSQTPMGSLQSQPPPMGGLQSQTPMGSLQSQPPPMGGLQAHTPPMGGLQSQTPPMGGLQAHTPPMGGLQSQTPMGGLQSQTPMGGLQSQTPIGGLQSQTPMGGPQSQTPPMGGPQSQTPRVRPPASLHAHPPERWRHDVDFSKIYRYLSGFDTEKQGPVFLTAMESAVVLDLLMSLPEELHLLDGSELHHHFMEVYKSLSSPASSSLDPTTFPVKAECSRTSQNTPTASGGPRTHSTPASRGARRPDSQSDPSAAYPEKSGEPSPSNRVGRGGATSGQGRDQDVTSSMSTATGRTCQSSSTQTEESTNFGRSEWEGAELRPLNPFRVPLKLLARHT